MSSPDPDIFPICHPLHKQISKSGDKKQNRDGMAMLEWQPLQPVPAPNWTAMYRSGAEVPL